jgi:hypothetical protein
LLTLRVSVNGIPCTFLVDSGANRNFIDKSFAKTHRLHLSNLRQPLRIRLADGTLSATAQELQDAVVQLTPDRQYTSSFVSTTLSGYDGILGKPFLNELNPVFDWPTNTIISPFRLCGEALPSPAVQVHVISAKRLHKLVRKTSDIELFKVLISQVSSASDSTLPSPDPVPTPK